ncbi:hypothetical protein NMY22_g3887 [Coprinellus aureogranulatus]|nr:hypothetical protein NMY22_g3887 [Coprinellus aureogranulatus]
MPGVVTGLVPQPLDVAGLQHIKQLQKYMTTTHPTYEAFNRIVERSARVAKTIGLNKELYSHQFNSRKWQTYVNKVCICRPELRQFEGCWPLRVMHDIRVRKHHAYKAAEAPATVFLPFEARTRRLSGRTIASGSLYSATRASRNTQEERGERGTPSEKPYVLITRSSIDSRHVVSSAKHTRHTSALERSPSQAKAVGYTSLPAAISQSQQPFNTNPVVHLGCLNCGRGPGSVGSTFALRTIIGADALEHLLILSNAGLVDDARLKIYRAWPVEQQTLFVMSLPVTPFVKQALLRKLGLSSVDRIANGEMPCYGAWTAAATAGPSGSKQYPQPTRIFSGVPQPSREAEERLTDANEPIELLRSAMDLDDRPSLFDEVLHFFRRDGFPYLLSLRPSEEETEKAVKAIAREKLLFERYENYWPIRFLIKRIIRKRFSNSTGSELWVRPPLETPSQEPAEAADPPRTVYSCRSHAGPDLSRVTPHVQVLLFQRGLMEFAPIFAYLGIRTEADFTEFCAFSGGEKRSLVKEAQHQLGKRLVLNAFQKMALELEFTAGK